ncbi:hypothetical protein EDD11_009484, partial [Mortierella claussenii]
MKVRFHCSRCERHQSSSSVAADLRDIELSQDDSNFSALILTNIRCWTLRRAGKTAAVMGIALPIDDESCRIVHVPLWINLDASRLTSRILLPGIFRVMDPVSISNRRCCMVCEGVKLDLDSFVKKP